MPPATPLHSAAKDGDLDAVKDAYESDPYSLAARDPYGYTAIMLACERQHTEVVNLLRSYGARFPVKWVMAKKHVTKPQSHLRNSNIISRHFKKPEASERPAFRPCGTNNSTLDVSQGSVRLSRILCGSQDLKWTRGSMETKLALQGSGSTSTKALSKFSKDGSVPLSQSGSAMMRRVHTTYYDHSSSSTLGRAPPGNTLSQDVKSRFMDHYTTDP